MGVFGNLQVRIDPWEVEYGSELPLEVAEEVASDEVTLDIELPLDAWRPIEPRVDAYPSRLIFVDGVRRIETRLIVRKPDGICHGVFGSYAVGCVSVAEGMASWGTIYADHVIALGSGETLPSPVAVAPGLVYRPVSSADTNVDAPLRAIQDEMRLAEERLAREAADTDADTLVVADGPLTFEDPVRGGAVGYVKRLFRLYVPERVLSLLAALQPGMRSPLFALRSTQRFARYSWFVRLTAPSRGGSDLAGIVRLEVSDTVGVEVARQRACQTAALLPRFVPSRTRDPRAPQNLLPIGALEAQLRRRLGDARLARRRIETLVAQEATDA